MSEQGRLGKALLFIAGAYEQVEYLAAKGWLVHSEYWQATLRQERKDLIESSLEAIKEGDGLKMWKVQNALQLAKDQLEPLAEPLDDRKTMLFLTGAREEIVQEMLKTSKNFRF